MSRGRKSAGGEPYDLTDLMRYIYDGAPLSRPFPSPTSLPLKETYRRRVYQMPRIQPALLFPAYRATYFSLFLFLFPLPLKLASPGFSPPPSRPPSLSLSPSIRLRFFFPSASNAIALAFPPRRMDLPATLSARDDVGLIKFRSFH